jgi:hypothetical protein
MIWTKVNFAERLGLLASSWKLATAGDDKDKTDGQKGSGEKGAGDDASGKQGKKGKRGKKGKQGAGEEGETAEGEKGSKANNQSAQNIPHLRRNVSIQCCRHGLQCQRSMDERGFGLL